MEEFKDYQNIKEMMVDLAKQIPNHLAFIKKIKENEYEEITYEKFVKQIYALGTALYEMGLKDTRIAIIGRNQYEWVLSHTCNMFGSNVSVPLDKELKYIELEESLIRSKAEAIIFDEKYLEGIKELQKNQKTALKKYICMSDIDGFDSVRKLVTKGEKLIKSGKKEFMNHQVDSHKMSILLFTSGTTSKSKAVMLSQRNITSNIYGMLQHEKFYDTDTNIAFLPYHHIFGSTCMYVMLAAKVKTVYCDGIRYIAKNFNEYHVSVFVGVPAILEALYKNIWKNIEKQGKTKLIKAIIKISNCLLKLHIDVRRKLFKPILDGLGGKLRFIVSGGAALDKEIEDGFRAFGIKVAQGYGLTETAPVIAAETFFKERSGTIGIPLPNVEVEIVKPDENGIGELRTKGPNIMLGYYEDEERTNEVLKDGWFYTGDLGYFDKQGFIHLTGRKKDMIVLKNGKKVFPEEIETLINRFEITKESFVYGKPENGDMNDLQVAVKIVYDKEKREELYPGKTEEEFFEIVWNEIKALNERFPAYKHIKALILTEEELIKTTTQKVKRQEELKKVLEETK